MDGIKKFVRVKDKRYLGGCLGFWVGILYVFFYIGNLRGRLGL